MSLKLENFDFLVNGKRQKTVRLFEDFVDFLGLSERALTITFHSEFPNDEIPNGQRFQVATTDKQFVYLKMKIDTINPVFQVLFTQPANISFGLEMDWGKYVYLGVQLFNSLTKVFNYKTGLVKFRRLYKIFSGANFRVASLDERVSRLVGNKSAVSAQMVLYLKTGKNFYGTTQNIEGSASFCWSEDFHVYMKYFGQYHEDYRTLPELLLVEGALPVISEKVEEKLIPRPPIMTLVDGLKQAYETASLQLNTAEEYFIDCETDLLKIDRDIRKADAECGQLEAEFSAKQMEVLRLKEERDRQKSERSSLKDEVVRCRRRLKMASDRLQSRDLEMTRQVKLAELLKLFKGEEARLLELIQKK